MDLQDRIQKNDDRIRFLEDWNRELLKDISFDNLNKVYHNQNEIDAKKMLNDNYKKQIEQSKNQDSNLIRKSLKEAVGKMSGLAVHSQKAKDLKRGIIKRFKKGEYESMQKMKDDLQNAIVIINKYQRKPLIHKL